jgi:hypothetical protein
MSVYIWHAVSTFLLGLGLSSVVFGVLLHPISHSSFHVWQAIGGGVAALLAIAMKVKLASDRAGTDA